MPAFSDLAGKRFGRLAAIERAGVTGTGKVTWRCSCDCGATSVVSGVDLRSGHTTSCGCARDERNRTSSLSHGLRRSATYSTWTAMKSRCSNPNVKSFADYGARGVRVCDRWASSFKAFLADMGERPEGKTLDRWPDTRGNYEPGNCRWATATEQHRNTTANALLTYGGETLTQVEWAQRTGIAQKTLSYRMRRGWTPEQAISTLVRLGNRVVASKFGEEVELT